MLHALGHALTTFTIVQWVAAYVDMKDSPTLRTEPRVAASRLLALGQTNAAEVEPFFLTLCTQSQPSRPVDNLSLRKTYILVITGNHGPVADIPTEAVSRLVWINIFNRLILHHICLVLHLPALLLRGT